MADPIQQIFMQAGAATAQGQGFGQFAVTGAQLALQRRELALNQNMLRARRELIIEQASGEAAQLELDAMSRPEGFADPEIFSKTEALFKRVPVLWGTNQGKQLLNEIRAARMVKQVEMQRQQGAQIEETIKTPTGSIRVSPGFTPQTRTLKDASGRDVQMVQTGPESWREVRGEDSSASAPGVFEKDIEYMKRAGVQMTPEQIQKYYDAKTFGQAGRDVEPQVKVIEGQKFIVNPKTGSVHRLDPMVSRSRFIADNVSRWVSDGLAKDENEAAAKLGAFYDQHISQSTPQTTDAAPAAVKTIGGFKVRVIKP